MSRLWPPDVDARALAHVTPSVSDEQPESFTAPSIQFVGEQDGPVEREFKAALVSEIGERVRAAFLARVTYPGSDGISVALCLAGGSEESTVVNDAAATFRRMFGSHEHLDILFLNPDQEADIRSVCSPFIGA